MRMEKSFGVVVVYIQDRTQKGFSKAEGVDCVYERDCRERFWEAS